MVSHTHDKGAHGEICRWEDMQKLLVGPGAHLTMVNRGSGPSWSLAAHIEQHVRYGTEGAQALSGSYLLVGQQQPTRALTSTNSLHSDQQPDRSELCLQHIVPCKRGRQPLNEPQAGCMTMCWLCLAAGGAGDH